MDPQIPLSPEPEPNTAPPVPVALPAPVIGNLMPQYDKVSKAPLSGLIIFLYVFPPACLAGSLLLMAVAVAEGEGGIGAALLALLGFVVTAISMIVSFIISIVRLRSAHQKHLKQQTADMLVPIVWIVVVVLFTAYQLYTGSPL